MTRLGLGPFADPAVMQQLLGGMSGYPVAQGAGGLGSLVSAFMSSGQFGIPGNPLLDFAISNPRTMAELSRMPEYAPAVAQRALQLQIQPQQRRQVTAANADFGRFTNEQLLRASRMPEFAQGAYKEAHRRNLSMGDLQKQYGKR